LFTSKEIKKGEIIWTYRKEDEIILTAEQFEKTEHFTYFWNGRYRLSIDIDRFENHSCNPNTESFDAKTDVASRDISVGEEITYDYANIMTSEELIKCNCGSDNCRKIIKGNHMLVQSRSSLTQKE